jgi:ABC-type bacteriocin/lantibiotic exporter with double-glycine peptidase domain
VMQAAVLWYGGQYVIRGELSVGAFAGFLAIRELLEAPLHSLVSVFDGMVHMRGAFERSDEVFSVEPERFGERCAANVRGRIELRDVGFRYGSGGAWVLRNVNLTIEAGEHIVIVGPSGGGKSTLGQLLCGALRPTEGEVLLDGEPITSYEASSLAACFGVVLQEPLILPGTVEDALCLRLPDATPDAMERALALAELQGVVEAMPAGLDTRLLQRGANLSGGERQRLAIAQACIGDPCLLLLDEATCALDDQTELLILERLDRHAATVIAIAHRASVISRAGRVVGVDGGSIAELRARPSRQQQPTDQNLPHREGA